MITDQPAGLRLNDPLRPTSASDGVWKMKELNVVGDESYDKDIVSENTFGVREPFDSGDHRRHAINEPGDRYIENICGCNHSTKKDAKIDGHVRGFDVRPRATRNISRERRVIACRDNVGLVDVNAQPRCVSEQVNKTHRLPKF